MIDGFVKLYASILTSSIWLEDDATLRVWIAMLSTADWHGYVGASVGGLAHVARVEREACIKALAVLEAPDPDSRTPDDEGRRIKKVDGGWIVLNIKKYRDMRTVDQVKEAERKAAYRAKQRGEVGQGGTVPNVPETSGQMLDGDVDGDKSTPSHAPAREEPEETDEATMTIYRFAGQFENPDSWVALLLGYVGGLGTPRGEAATREQVAQACNEADALGGGEMSPRRFRRVLGQIMEKPEIRTAATGKTLRAGEIIALVRKNRNPAFPHTALPAWRDELSQREVRAVNAIGVDRILNDKVEGVVLSQLAKALVEAEA